MQVKDIMTSDVTFCGTNATLTDVAMAMWNKDCGSIPVVNQDKKVVGIITDRDICMAVATRNARASEIVSSDLIGGLLRVCSPEDDIETALEIMAHAQLRRLPVVDKDGTLCGILSISDAIKKCAKDDKKNKKRVSRKSVLKTLRAICENPTTQQTAVEEIAEAKEVSFIETTKEVIANETIDKETESETQKAEA